MFINIQVLSKNQNSLKKFLTFFNSFCMKKPVKKKIYTGKKKVYVLKKKVKKTLYVKYKDRYLIKKLTITEKNKKRLKLNGFLNYLQQKQNRKFFTTLKSPHVNKTAQEQVEYREFAKQITVFSFQILKFLILLKKIHKSLFPDVEIKIKFILKNKTIKKTKLVAINPDNYKIKSFLSGNKKKNINNTSKQKQMIAYLKLFDIYGELNFKTCSDSSVGRAKD